MRQQLDKHLAPLKRQKVIEAWHDRQIQAGHEWANQIDDNLNKADIIILLVSPDFVASDYCFDIEMEQAMKRHNDGEAVVVPVVLEPCNWSGLRFAKLQAFPKDAKAITTWQNQNEAFMDVAAGIGKVAQDLFVKRQQKLQQKQTDREEYKAKVEEALSLSTDGKISIADRDTLEELCEKLKLTKEETDTIEENAYKPYKAQQEKLEKYKKTLLKYIENGDYPFSDDVKRQLEIRQRDLGIKPKDIERLTRPILAEEEVKYQQKLQAETAKRQRQLELEAETQRQRQQEQQEQQEYESKLRSYEQDFTKAVQAEYPLSQYLIDRLKNNQQQLGLKNEDVARIEQPIRELLEVKYHLDLGKTLKDQWKLEEAITEFQKVLQINPSNVDAYTNLGDALSEQNKNDEAIAEYRKALQIDPHNVLAHTRLGMSLTVQRKLEEAITECRTAIQLDPNHGYAHAGLGFVLAVQGKSEEAITECRIAIQLDPNNKRVCLFWLFSSCTRKI